MTQRFNVLDARQCPVCFRRGAIVLVDSARRIYACDGARDGGCATRFTLTPADGDIPATLTVVPVEQPIRRLTLDELDQVRTKGRR